MHLQGPLKQGRRPRTPRRQGRSRSQQHKSVLVALFTSKTGGWPAMAVLI